MSIQVGTTTMTSAQDLTGTYALADNALQAVYSTDKWLQLYAEAQVVLEVTYTTGAAETSNYLEFYIEYGSGAPSLITWSQETVEYLDDSADQIVLEPWTYRIDGASAGTAYIKRLPLPVCDKGIRIYVKEVGVAANFGTVTIKANLQAAGSGFLNRSLQTVTLETGGTTLPTNLTEIGGVAVPADGGAFTADTTPVLPAGYLYEATRSTVDDGDIGAAAMTSDRKQIGAAYDAATGADLSFEAAPLNTQYSNVFIDEDTTNVGAGPTYYPATNGISTNGLKTFTLTGKLIEADAESNTLEIQGTNDETLAGATWQTVYFFDNISNSWVNSYTCNATTTNMAATMESFGFENMRLKFVGGASATNTIEIKVNGVPL